MKIVRKRQVVQVERYDLCFEWKDMPRAGFSFSCNKQGEPILNEMQPEGRKNLEKCLSGEYNVTPQGVRDSSYTYQQPAQGHCSCGEIIELIDFTNTCDCGREYNLSGQQLAPRSQWEEACNED